MRLTKQTGYAIRVLIDCARAEGRLAKAADIAERLGITPQNVFKIVHLLSRAGFVGAVRGRKGGVRLARPAREIRIGEVVRAMEVTNVEVERRDPQSEPAGINRVLDAALEAFVGVLDRHTLEDMASAGADKFSIGDNGEQAGPRSRAAAVSQGSERRAAR